MAFSYGFFNAQNLDRVYTAEDFTAYLSSLICNGILDTYRQCFAPTVKSLSVTFGTGKADEEKLAKAVDKVFDLRPTAIIEMLDLRKPQYRQLAAYGHMGREDLGVAWEKTDRVDALKAALA